MTDSEELDQFELEREDETLPEGIEIFTAAPDFEVSPSRNVIPDTSVQDDEVEVEIKEVKS